MSEWKQVLWGDIATLEYGRALRGYQDATGPVRVFGTNGPVGWTSEALSDGPGVIIGRKGAYRGVHYSEGPFWVIDTAYYLKPKCELDLRWAYYALKNQDINSMDSGSAIPSTSRADFYALSVKLPPLSDQRAIAAVLGALDDKIAVNERIANTAESLSLALASEDLWKERIPLGDLVRHLREQVAPSSIEAARVAHYSLPAFDQGRLPEIIQPKEIKSAKFRVSAGAVLLSKLNPATPRAWNVEPDPSLPALASTEFLVLQPKDGIHPAELWAVCNQVSFRDDVAGKATGTSNSHQRAKPSDILASYVVDPRSMNVSSREQIVSLCGRAKLARIESQKLADLRDTLLPGLVSGAIRVRDAEKAVEDAT